LEEIKNEIPGNLFLKLPIHAGIPLLQLQNALKRKLLKTKKEI
jgi:hypothetical protein